jgi:hypothetical protein
METVNEHPSVEVDVCPVLHHGFFFVVPSSASKCLSLHVQVALEHMLSPMFFETTLRSCGDEGVRPRNLTPQKMIHVAVSYELAGGHLK